MKFNILLMWIIWRGKYWAFRNQWRGQRAFTKWGVVFFAICSMIGLHLLYWHLYGQFGGDKSHTLFAGAFLVMCQFYFITLGFSFRRIYRAFYQASDISLLRTAPIPSSTIFLSKVGEGSVLMILPIVLGGTVLFAYGHAQHYDLLYSLWVVGVLVGLWLLLIASAVGLILVLVRYFDLRQIKSLLLLIALPLIFGSLLAIWLSAVSANAEVTRRVACLVSRLGSLHYMLPLVLMLGSLTSGVLILWVDYWLYQCLFYDGWVRTHEVPIQLPHQGSLHWLERIARAISGKLSYVVIAKDWLLLWRDPKRLLVPLALPVSLVILPVLDFIRGTPLYTIVIWMYLSVLILWMPLAIVGLALDFVAVEGRNLALFLYAPLRAGLLLKSKWWGLFFPMESVALLLIVIIGLVTNMSLAMIILLVLGGSYCVGAISSAGVAIGGKASQYCNETGDNSRFAVWALPLGLTLAYGIVGLTLFTGIWGYYESAYPKGTPLWSEVLRNTTLVHWAFVDAWRTAIVLVGLHVVYWGVTYGLWNLSVTRLKGLDGL